MKNGYLFSYSVRGATQEFKKYVLDQMGYRSIGKDFKIKSHLEPREILVTSKNGKKLKKTVDEKQVIFYSEKYVNTRSRMNALWIYIVGFGRLRNSLK